MKMTLSYFAISPTSPDERLLYEPEDKREGDFWFPDSEKEIQAFRQALEYAAS